MQATTNRCSVPWHTDCDPELAALRARAPPRIWEDYAVQKNIPLLERVCLPFYGSPKVVAAQWEYARDKFSAAIPGARFQDGASYRFPLDADQLAKIANPVPFGVPSLQTFSVGGPRSQGHMWFSPIIPMTGESVLEAQRVFDQVHKDLGESGGASAAFPVWSFFARAFVIIYFFPIEHDVEKNRRNREIFFRRLVTSRRPNTRGASTARTPRSWGRHLGRLTSTNSTTALRRLHESIMDALDP